MARPRRAIVVGFELIEKPEERVFRQAWAGKSVDEIVAEKPVGLGTYWCAACQPAHPPLRKIYRTTEVPEVARCCVCDIELRELQEMYS